MNLVLLRNRASCSLLGILMFVGATASCGGGGDDGGDGGGNGGGGNGGTSGAMAPAECGDTFTKAAGSYTLKVPTIKAQAESHFASNASYDVEVSNAGSIVVKATKKGDLTFAATKLTCTANGAVMSMDYEGDPALGAIYNEDMMKFLVLRVQVGTGADGNVIGMVTKK